MTIKIVANDKGNPPGKLADAELHFTDGPLEGLKLIGFAVWERKTGAGRNVTFPARAVLGQRRAPQSFALLRPVDRQHRAEPHARSDPRGVRGVRRRRSSRPPDESAVQAGEPAIDGLGETGRNFLFSAERFGGSVHSSRRPLSNSARKNDAFMPPSMMSHGSTASSDRSRKM